MTRQDFQDYPALLARLRAERDDIAKQKEAQEAPKKERAAFIQACARAFVETASYETLERVSTQPPAVPSDDAPAPVYDLAFAAGYVKDRNVHDSEEAERFVEAVLGKGEEMDEVEAVAFSQAVARHFATIRHDILRIDLIGEA